MSIILNVFPDLSVRLFIFFFFFWIFRPATEITFCFWMLTKICLFEITFKTSFNLLNYHGKIMLYKPKNWFKICLPQFDSSDLS